MEKHYLIKWEIDEFAETPLEAIRKALKAMPTESNPESVASVFDVQEIDGKGKVVKTHQIDILDEDGLPITNEETIEPELRKSLLSGGFQEPEKWQLNEFEVIENGVSYKLNETEYEKVKNLVYSCDECKCLHVHEGELNNFLSKLESK